MQRSIDVRSVTLGVQDGDKKSYLTIGGKSSNLGTSRNELITQTLVHARAATCNLVMD